MRSGGGQQLYAGGEAGAVAYNSVYAPSQQQQYGPRPAANMPAAAAPGHMGGPASMVAQRGGGGRVDESPLSAAPGPMKGGAKAATMFAGQQQQRSAPYLNPHRYMQSRRPQFINGQTAEVHYLPMFALTSRLVVLFCPPRRKQCIVSSSPVIVSTEPLDRISHTLCSQRYCARHRRETYRRSSVTRFERRV